MCDKTKKEMIDIHRKNLNISKTYYRENFDKQFDDVVPKIILKKYIT